MTRVRGGFASCDRAIAGTKKNTDASQRARDRLPLMDALLSPAVVLPMGAGKVYITANESDDSDGDRSCHFLAVRGSLRLQSAGTDVKMVEFYRKFLNGLPLRFRPHSSHSPR